MNEMRLNKARLNVVSLNKALINGAVERHGSSAGGGGEVIPPEEPDVPDVPVTYILSASASNGVVSASVNGNAVTLPYTANEGDVVVVEVTANDGYEFEGWSDGSTDNPRSITMTADVTLSATCVVKAVEKEYIEFADPAVEAVLMANGVSSDGVGITKEDAAAVTSIGTWFKGNTEITSFNELRYFTGVTTINSNAFKGCTALKTLSFDNITKVGNDAYWNVGAFDGCTSLERAIMPKVTEIANYSFANCSSLSEAYMPNVTLIGSVAFKGTRIGGSHTIEYCQSIGAAAFMGTYIDEIIAPSLTSITGQWDSGAFADCCSLRTVRVGDAVALGERTFRNCSALETFIISATTPPSLNAALFSGTNSTFLIYVPDAALEVYKTATNWSAYADRIHPLSELEGSPYITFADPEVERVLMENNVSSDGVGITMADAQAVTSFGMVFTINKVIESFEEFEYFTGITTLGGNYTTFALSSLKEISIPASVEMLTDDTYGANLGAFRKCASLTTIGDTSHIKKLGRYSFENCSAYSQDVNMPSLEGTIGYLAMYGVAITRIVNLGKAEVLEGVATASVNSPQGPFARCQSLIEAHLPASLKEIQKGAFGFCTALTTLIIDATTPPTLDANAWYGSNALANIYVPDASVDAYKAAANWSTYADRIKPLSEYVES